jgi:hypothetical protein
MLHVATAEEQNATGMGETWHFNEWDMQNKLKHENHWKQFKTHVEKSARLKWFPKFPLDFPKSVSIDTLDLFFVSNEGPGR